MNKTLSAAVMALLLAGATITSLTVSATPARAANVTFDLGDVAIGYSDGYWDRDHHWHKWQNTKHREAYQHNEGAEYHATAHTRAPNQGWHERDEHEHDDHAK